MTRGNQRDKDRARAQARAEKHAKGSKGGDHLKRNEDDKAALQAKIAAKKKAKEDGTLTKKGKGGGTKNPYKGMKKTGKVAINPHTGKKDAAWGKKGGKSAGFTSGFK